jgi:MSHA biogenesis protein MshK
MAEHLSAGLMRKIAIAGLVFAATSVLTSAWALADDIPDPMRPPVGFGQGLIDETPAGPVLQSVLISPTRRIAIISGKTVQVGDKFGDAQVAAISENEVVLKSGKNRQVLKLFPTLRDLAPAGSKERNRDIPGQPK